MAGGQTTTLYGRTLEFFEHAFAGFRPRMFEDAACQFEVTSETDEPVTFHLLVGRDDLKYRHGSHRAPDVQITLSLATLERLIDLCEQSPVDLFDPRVASDITVLGDSALAGRITALLTQAKPEQIERYARARILDSRLGAAEVWRVERPTESELIASLGSGRPVVATGSLRDWESLAWNFDELQHRFGAVDLVPAEQSPNERISIGEFLSRGPSQEHPYSAGFALPKPLVPFFEFPYFKDHLGSPNLWLGWKVTGQELTYLHRDPSYILHAQVLGSKEWWLYPPSQEQFLYPYKTFNGFQRCWVDPSERDLVRFPQFENAVPYRITVGPGELLLMPPGWFHVVYAGGSPLLSVTRGISRTAESQLFGREARPEVTDSGRRRRHVELPPSSQPPEVSPAPAVKCRTAFPALAELIAPFQFERFVDHYWEAQPLLIERSQPQRFSDLLSFDEVDRALSSLDLHPPQLRVFKDGDHVDVAEITTAQGRFDPLKVMRLFDGGATVILSELDFVLPHLAAFCRRLEAELSHPLQTNVYMTPPGRRGFVPHYDSHDVFVLQVEGKKYWHTYRAPIVLPLKSQGWVRDEYEPGEPTSSFIVSPGDTLYIPRGLMHDAECGDAVSLHITLSVSGFTWTDLLLEALQRRSQREPSFRRSLPFGFARADTDGKALRSTFASLLETLSDASDFDEAISAVVRDFIGSRRPLVRGQLEALRRIGEVTLDTLVQPRPDLLCRIEAYESGIELLVNGVRIPLPKAVEPLVQFAIATPRFSPRDMPGPLGPKSKLTVVHRLIREGVLVPGEPGPRA